MPDSADVRLRLQAALADTQAWLRDRRDDGAQTAAADPARLADLAKSSPPPARPPAGGGHAALADLAAEIGRCTRCPLHRTRTRTVPGQGCPRPDILFVGEGPGFEEDRQGLAFVGPAGKLLTRLIEALGYTRDTVFIANIVKCRPTVEGRGQTDRPPSPEEMQACLPYLRQQIALLQPRVIVCLGNVAMEGLLGIKGITRLRGQWKTYENVPLMPTYHPSFLLRGGGEGKARYWDVWDDMGQVLTRLGRTPPPKQRKTVG